MDDTQEANWVDHGYQKTLKGILPTGEINEHFREHTGNNKHITTTNK